MVKFPIVKNGSQEWENSGESAPRLLYQPGPRSPMRSRTSSRSLWEPSREQRGWAGGWHFICFLWWWILRTHLLLLLQLEPSPHCPIRLLNKGSGWAWQYNQTTSQKSSSWTLHLLPSRAPIPLCSSHNWHPALRTGKGKQNGLIPKLVALLQSYFSIWETQLSFFFSFAFKILEM